MTVKNIIDELNKWKGDIDYDIKQDYYTDAQKADFIRQSIAISQTIGIIQGIGNNNNIPINN